MNLIKLLIATLRNWNIVRLLMSAGKGIKATISAVIAFGSAVALIFGGNLVAGIPALVLALKALFVVFGGLAIFLLQAALSALESLIGQTQQTVAMQHTQLAVLEPMVVSHRNALAEQANELVTQRAYTAKMFAEHSEKLKTLATTPVPKPQSAPVPNQASAQQQK